MPRSSLLLIACVLAAGPALAQTAPPTASATGRYGPAASAPQPGAGADPGASPVRLLSWSGKSPPRPTQAAASPGPVRPVLLPAGLLAHSAVAAPSAQAPLAPPVQPAAAVVQPDLSALAALSPDGLLGASPSLAAAAPTPALAPAAMPALAAAAVPAAPMVVPPVRARAPLTADQLDGL